MMRGVKRKILTLGIYTIGSLAAANGWAAPTVSKVPNPEGPPKLKQLTPAQRKFIDRLVGAQLRFARSRQSHEIPHPQRADLKERDKDPDLFKSALRSLAARAPNGVGSLYARRVGNYARALRQRGESLPPEIVKQAAEDVLWHYHWADNVEGGKNVYKVELARALLDIGHPKALSLAADAVKTTGQFSLLWDWAGVADPRLFSAIEANLPTLNPGETDPIFYYLKSLGKGGTPLLERIARPDTNVNDPGLKRRALGLLAEHAPLTALKFYREYEKDATGEDKEMLHRAVLRLRSRHVDKLFQPPALPPEDRLRIECLTEVATYSYRPVFRSRLSEEAGKVLVRIGYPATGVLREQLPLFYNSEEPVTWGTAEFLFRMGAPGIPALIDGLTEGEWVVRRGTAQALSTLTGRAFTMDFEDWSRWYLEARKKGPIRVRMEVVKKWEADSFAKAVAERNRAAQTTRMRDGAN